MRLLNAGDVGYEVFGSNGLAADELLAVALNGLVSATDSVPRFDVSTQATVVSDDAAAQLVVGTSTASGPARSLRQTDSVGLRMTNRVQLGKAHRHRRRLARRSYLVTVMTDDIRYALYEPPARMSATLATPWTRALGPRQALSPKSFHPLKYPYPVTYPKASFAPR
jgi:hypothetical protein